MVSRTRRAPLDENPAACSESPSGGYNNSWSPLSKSRPRATGQKERDCTPVSTPRRSRSSFTISSETSQNKSHGYSVLHVHVLDGQSSRVPRSMTKISKSVNSTSPARICACTCSSECLSPQWITVSLWHRPCLTFMSSLCGPTPGTTL